MMTINRSIAVLVNDLTSMERHNLTDAYVLDLHLRHIKAAGHLTGSVGQRRGAVRRLGDHLDPYSQDPRAVLDATADQLAEWQASKADCSSSYLSSQIAHLRQFYDWLVSPMGLRQDTPASGLLSPIVRKRLPRPIPEDDYEYALTACADAKVFAWLILGGYAGFRGVDIADLDHPDVLTDDEVPFLRARGKGDNEQLIAIGHEVVDALGPFLGPRRGPIFVGANGGRLRARDVYDEINAYLARIGLPYTFHNCRHRYGTQLYKLTKDIRFVQKQMRHRGVASTEGYVAVPTDQAVSAMAALDNDLLARTRARRRRRGRSS